VGQRVPLRPPGGVDRALAGHDHDPVARGRRSADAGAPARAADGRGGRRHERAAPAGVRRRHRRRGGAPRPGAAAREPGVVRGRLRASGHRAAGVATAGAGGAGARDRAAGRGHHGVGGHRHASPPRRADRGWVGRRAPGWERRGGGLLGHRARRRPLGEGSRRRRRGRPAHRALRVARGGNRPPHAVLRT
jgi:hypothetical protein